jgi:hypothetical protein
LPKNFNLIAAVSVLITGILIGGFLILSSKSGSADISQTISGLFGGNQKQDPKMADSDKDGLTDWQEEIYKTNPNNPDSDADGYFDGEEVMSGYDPLVAAPNDKLSDKAIEPRPKSGSLGVNLTDELAKALSEAMKASSQNSFQADSSGSLELTDSGLVDNALAAALAKSPQLYLIPTLEDRDIKISSDDSLIAGQNFVDQVAQILANNSQSQKIDMEAAQEAIQTKNYSELNQFIKNYKNSFLAIKELSAPPSWKEIHKKNLALIIANANILEAIKSIDQDPLRALIALQQYQEIVLPGLEQIADEGLKLIKQQRGIQ